MQSSNQSVGSDLSRYTAGWGSVPDDHYPENMVSQKNISVYQVVICLLDSIVQFSNKRGQCNMIIMKYWAISTSSWLTNWTLNEKGWLKDLAGVNVLCSKILFWKSS